MIEFSRSHICHKKGHKFLKFSEIFKRKSVFVKTVKLENIRESILAFLLVFRLGLHDIEESEEIAMIFSLKLNRSLMIFHHI